ncbi:MAG: hypothetical protein QGI12_00730 [Acidimicrobiales bacterium]|nr:hypothetical protein [Acidimicrobiales bacterium]
MPNLQLLDGSCENCIRLFAALEEIMATDAPVAIVLTSDGSIVLYMEDRFLVEDIPQKKKGNSDQNFPKLTGKEKKRRFKENPGKRIKIPKGNFSIIYSETNDKKQNPPSRRAENQRASQ